MIGYLSYTGQPDCFASICIALKLNAFLEPNVYPQLWSVRRRSLCAGLPHWEARNTISRPEWEIAGARHGSELVARCSCVGCISSNTLVVVSIVLAEKRREAQRGAERRRERIEAH